MDNTVTVADASSDDVPIIIDIAEKTWWPSYSSILTKEQIRYMLDIIFSPEVLQNSIRDKSQHFIMVYEGGSAQGFASFGPRPDDPSIVKLSKLYVLPETQGKGFGKILINNVVEYLLAQGIHTLELNVNRYNKAKTFYEKMGFRVIREEDIPIGPYWMNDYVMRLDF